MDEKMRFIAGVLEGEETMTALCEEFGISRGIFENRDGDGELYFGALHLGTIDAVSLKLKRPEQSSTERQGGPPSSRSSRKKVSPIFPV